MKKSEHFTTHRAWPDRTWLKPVGKNPGGISVTPVLVLEFTYNEWEEAHPYGSTTAHEKMTETFDESYNFCGDDETYDRIKEIFESNFPDLDLDEELESMKTEFLDKFFGYS